MAYKALYDEAYLRSLASQIKKLNNRKQKRRQSEGRAVRPPQFNFTESQRAASVILKSIKSKKKGAKTEHD